MIHFPALTAKVPLIRGIALLGICYLAMKANNYVSVIVRAFKLSLFLDTVFTCALTFAGGIVPGLMVSVMTAVDVIFQGGGFWPFQLCSMAEVLLVCLLRPRKSRRSSSLGGSGPEKTASFISTLAVLLVLYAAACVTVSLLGGIIDFVLYDILRKSKDYYSLEDTFKIGLLRSGSPVIVTNILSRIPINIVDRFIVIFGGFFLSLPLGKAHWLWEGGAKK
jgi:hypothetical protein